MLYFFRRLFFLAVIAILAFAAGNFLFIYFGDATKSAATAPGQTGQPGVYEKLRDIVHIRDIATGLSGKPGYVSLQDIPLQLRHAVVAVEDHKFYEHHGLDFEGIIRALLVNIQSGEIVEGGSTITQQLSRTLFLSNEQSASRKVWEAIFSIALETRLSKDKILELYLNTVYFGRNAHGVTAAAKVYYGKPLNRLNLSQMTMLAGILNGPALYDPDKEPVAARARQKVVIAAMLKYGFISQQEADNIPALQK